MSLTLFESLVIAGCYIVPLFYPQSYSQSSDETTAMVALSFNSQFLVSQYVLF